MTPAARVQSAIDLIGQWQESSHGLDSVLTRWARRNRYAGSGDRRAVADLAYDAMRRLRSAAWVSGDDTPRGVIRGSLMLDNQDLSEHFDGSRYGPAGLEPNELALPRDLAEARRAVRLDYPDWLENALQEVPDAALDALRARAPLDLRVNTLKVDLEGARDVLLSDGVECIPLDHAPHALRVTSGARKVSKSDAYQSGLIEIQDAASQAAAAFTAARPGMVVLDLCAGGGGKTLALGASLQGQGRLIAHDIAPGRMADLPARAARADVLVETISTDSLDELKERCDLVVVDAPCSGSGAWRRNPDYKWRLKEDSLSDLMATQGELLARAAGLCKPEGRVVYMTCSILELENTEQVRAFQQTDDRWQVDADLKLSPAEGTDGFYAAGLVRV